MMRWWDGVNDENDVPDVPNVPDVCTWCTKWEGCNGGEDFEPWDFCLSFLQCLDCMIWMVTRANEHKCSMVIDFNTWWRELAEHGALAYYVELLRRRTTTRIVSFSLFSEFSERFCLNENVKASFTQHSLNSLAFNFLKRLRSVRNTDTPNIATQRD